MKQSAEPFDLESIRSYPPDTTPYIREAVPEDYPPAGTGGPLPGVFIVDVVVNNTNPNLPNTDTANDGETSIAVNLANSDEIVITAFSGGWGANAPIYHSTDGGFTWTRQFSVPVPPGWPTGCPCDWTWDYGRNNQLSGTILAISPTTSPIPCGAAPLPACTNDVVTGTTTNPAQSASFNYFDPPGPPVQAQETNINLLNSLGNVDQPWVLVNPDPFTPAQDNVYVAYDDFNNTDTVDGPDMRVAVSYGQNPPNFTVDVQVGNAKGAVNPGLRLAEDPRTGFMWALWGRNVGGGADCPVPAPAECSKNMDYMLNRTTDGGANWGLNGNAFGIIVANADSTQPRPKFGTVNALLGGAHHAAVDPVTGDLYYVYGSRDPGTGKDRLAIRRVSSDGAGGVIVGGMCTSSESDCCFANGTPGCDDSDCQATVCAADPFCCDTTWDGVCAGEAEDMCVSFVTGQVEAALPVVGVAENGTVAVFYYTFDGFSSDDFPIFTAHLALSEDQGATFTTLELVTFLSAAPDSCPPATDCTVANPPGCCRQRVLGDYMQMQVVDNCFYGSFTANGVPFGRQTANHDPIFFRVCVGPQIQVPGSVIFDDTCVGDTGIGTLEVCSTGIESLVVEAITSSDAQFSVTEPSSGYPVMISPDFCFPFEAVFTPDSSGPQSASFSVFNNDPANPTVLVEATGSGTEPDLTTLITDGGDFGDVCVGDTADLELVINNSGDCDLSVNDITSDSALFQVADVVSFPVVIGPGDNVEVTIRFEPVALGPENATITIESDAGDQLVAVSGNAPPPNIAIVIADEGDYGDVCLGDFADLDLLISNSGECDLVVTDITSNDADFQVAGVMSFPLVVGPGDSLPVPIRFEPSSLGAHIATIGVNSDDPDTPFKKVAVSGNTPPGEIVVTGSTDFGDVCAEELAEKVVAVCNVGLCNLTVTDASIDCPDFTLINNPFPTVVSHDFCMDLVIRFTPTSAGPKECELTITSDDPVTPIVTRTLTANTPLASIDVPPDISFAPTVIQSIDACETPEPFPVSNTGTCNLEITEFAIVENTDEYSFAGLPSFPIILQPGHVVGSGDLETVFAPDVIGRDRLGELSVTYVSDPITGETMTETRALCGEGVHTGARVLVTNGGKPLDVVKLIKIRRMTGNNNQGPTDTVDTAKNVALQTVTQDPPCASFEYHREYGTVSNPIQLVPGAYLVTVKASIPGMNGFQQMTVAFDVSSCDFNPTIIVDF